MEFQLITIPSAVVYPLRKGFSVYQRSSIMGTVSFKAEVSIIQAGFLGLAEDYLVYKVFINEPIHAEARLKYFEECYLNEFTKKETPAKAEETKIIQIAT